MFRATGSFNGFSVNDQAEAKEFYTKILGLTLVSEEMGLTFKLPGGGAMFIYPKDDHQPATYTTMNFEVEKIDEAVDELKGQGVVFEQYEGMTDEQGIARGLSHNQGPDIAWFKDPAGNILSVLQDK